MRSSLQIALLNQQAIRKVSEYKSQRCIRGGRCADVGCRRQLPWAVLRCRQVLDRRKNRLIRRRIWLWKGTIA